MKNLLIIFFILISKNAFSENQTLTEYLMNKYADSVHKYEDEKKENFIANQRIEELEEELTDQNTNFNLLKEENKVLETTKNELENIKIIPINRTILIIFFIAIILSVLIILYLSIIISKQRKWRQKYFDDNLGQQYIAQLPERIADTIDKSEVAYNNLKESNRKQYDDFNQNLEQVVNLINQVNSVNTENVSKINDQLSALRKFSDEKNELVKKYQEFYNFGIIKSYILETISTIDHLEDSVRELENKNHPQEAIEAVNFAKLKLITVLENNNINQVQPNLEMTFNDPKQTIKCKVNKKTVSNEKTVGSIKNIMHSGYVGQISYDKEFVTIRPAYVNIYVNKTQEEN